MKKFLSLFLIMPFYAPAMNDNNNKLDFLSKKVTEEDLLTPRTARLRKEKFPIEQLKQKFIATLSKEDSGYDYSDESEDDNNEANDPNPQNYYLDALNKLDELKKIYKNASDKNSSEIWLCLQNLIDDETKNSCLKDILLEKIMDFDFGNAQSENE